MDRPTTDQVADQFTVAEAARHLGISENAVAQRIKRGTLPARKHAGRWIVTLVSDVVDREATGRGDSNRPVDDRESDRSADQEATDQPPAKLALSYQALAPMMERLEALSREAERERVGWESAERERDHEQAARHAAEQERDELRAEVQLLREIERVHESHEDTEPFTPVSPSDAPGREDAAQGVETPEHQGSWLSVAWRRLTGRS